VASPRPIVGVRFAAGPLLAPATQVEYVHLPPNRRSGGNDLRLKSGTLTRLELDPETKFRLRPLATTGGREVISVTGDLHSVFNGDVTVCLAIELPSVRAVSGVVIVPVWVLDAEEGSHNLTLTSSVDNGENWVAADTAAGVTGSRHAPEELVELEWDTTGLDNGMYLLRLTAASAMSDVVGPFSVIN
jgi:hypothetical protein